MIPTGSDPFTLVYEALWNLVEARPEFQVLPEKNLIKFIGTPNNPMKQGQITNDVPEITLTTELGEGNLHQDSDSSRITMRYNWIINSGSFDMGKAINPLNFALVCAMVNWRSVLTALRWQGKQFVQKSNLDTAQIGRSNPEHNNGVKGWTAIWSCSVEMWLPTQLMLQ